ncbi:MAG TPA: DUF5615 family PIN-like protein [Acidimicrobiales bacterium]|nr:DUF5615 family PIN-like protein [Acidimicrobiales bacterium]
MRFLLDAQLPSRLARKLTSGGHDVVHTSELPDGNRTTDAEIARRADAEDRVVVTKDSDFRDGHLLRSTPRRLLIVAPATSATTPSSLCSANISTPSSLRLTKCASWSCGPISSWSTRS